MKTNFAFALSLLFSAHAFAAAPATLQAETSFHTDRADYKVHGTFKLKKENAKKVTYLGKVVLEDRSFTGRAKEVDADLVVEAKATSFVEKAPKWVGTLQFGDLTLYSFEFEQPTELPTSDVAVRAEFQQTQYDPGPPDSPIGGIWIPVASHATEITLSY